MSKTQLSSRERVRRAMERRDHDRVPRYEHFWPETLEAWRSQGLAGDPAEAFGFDLHKCGHLRAEAFPGRRQVVEEDEQTRVFIGSLGERWRQWKHHSGTPEHLGCECETPEVWYGKYKALLAPERMALDREAFAAQWRPGHEAGRWCCIGSGGVFCRLQTMVGDVTLLTAMAAEPEWVRDMAETYTSALLALYDQAFDAVDGALHGLFFYDDLAYTQAPFMSPAMYRQLVRPSHERVADWAHRRGLKLILHTDGDVRAFVDQFIDLGADCLQPLEAKANMDLRQLVPAHGDRLSFFGNIDARALITNDRDRIEAEVRAKLDAGMARRGYLFHSDHSIPPQVTLATYRFVRDLLDRYGAYA